MKKLLPITIIILFLTLFIKTYNPGDSLLISAPSTYGRGWPLPFLVWDISHWPADVEGTLTYPQLAHEYSYNNVFLPINSLVGLIISFSFWYVIVLLMSKLTSYIKKKSSQHRLPARDEY